MKKLLLVLLVVTLASFLFVGCIPVTPPAEGEGEGEAEICPTVSITSQVAVDGKNYIKAGSQTVTVTFAVPTEPVSVYVGAGLRLVLEDMEVVMYANADKTVYTGDFKFGDYSPDCGEAYIYVETCDTCEPCKYPYTVDGVIPDADLEVCASTCDCGGCQISFTSTVLTSPCNPDEELCWDDCSGIAGWSIAIYDQDPYDECCDMPCVEPIYTCTGVDPFCPIECVTDCLDECDAQGMMELYVVWTIWDMVGNENVEGEMILVDCDSCEVVSTTPIDSECVDPLELNLCEPELARN
jgi:hypothetical protein